jgi:hypothetical protein
MKKQILLILFLAVFLICLKCVIGAPFYFDFSNSTNASIPGKPTLFSLNWTNNADLSGYIFQICNGTWDGNNCQYTSTNSSTNWLSGWTYRKSHIIMNSTGADVNYTVQIVVKNSTDTDSGGTVFIDNKTRPDFGDVRFTNASSSLLDYWIENVTLGVNATFWVKIDGNLSTADQKIYIYYGNSTATNLSNGTQTFDFFDDFSVSPNGWTLSGATISAGLLNIPGGAWNYANKTRPSGYDDYRFRFRESCAATNFGWQAKSRGQDAGWNKIPIFQSYDYYYNPISTVGYITAGNVGTSYLNPARDSEYHTIEILKGGSSYTANWDNLTVSCTDPTAENGTCIAFTVPSGLSASTPLLVDWVFLAKYVNPEPVHGAWGSEEDNGFTEWVNDTWTDFGGGSWSNVTKTINSTIGAGMAWCVYANDTLGNWNGTSCQNPFSFTTKIVLALTVESARMNPESQLISRPGSEIEIHGRAFYVANGEPYPNEQLTFSYGSIVLGTNTTDAWGNYSFTFSIPYEGDYLLSLAGTDIQNTTSLHISTHPTYVKYKMQYHLGSDKSDDVYRIGTSELTNETVDGGGKANLQYSNNLTHGYICSYDKVEYPDGLLLGMSHSGLAAGLYFVNFSSMSGHSDYSLELKQKIQDDTLLLIYSKGTCQIVSDKMYLVEKNEIPSRAFSSFGYPTPSATPVLIQFSNDRIQIAGSDRFSVGDYKICVQKSGISPGNKPMISVRTC